MKPSIYFHLPERAQDATRHISTEQLRGPTGVDILLKELDSIYLPAKSYRRQQAFQKIIRIKRSPEVPVMEFLAVFKTAFHDMRELGLNMTEDTLALCLLEACDLSNEAQRHVVVAVPGKPEDMTYEDLPMIVTKTPMQYFNIAYKEL